MITDPPVLALRRHFQRPPGDLVAAFAGAATGHVVIVPQRKAREVASRLEAVRKGKPWSKRRSKRARACSKL